MRGERLAWADCPKTVTAVRRESDASTMTPARMTASSIEVTRTVGDYAHGHRMKPGMTGWALVNDSREPCHTPEEVCERVCLDMEYVNRASVWLDMWIAMRTIPCLLGDSARSR